VAHCTWTTCYYKVYWHPIRCVHVANDNKSKNYTCHFEITLKILNFHTHCKMGQINVCHVSFSQIIDYLVKMLTLYLWVDLSSWNWSCHLKHVMQKLIRKPNDMRDAHNGIINNTQLISLSCLLLQNNRTLFWITLAKGKTI
jgi:hypothetical protein